jgi:hypothetical protein
MLAPKTLWYLRLVVAMAAGTETLVAPRNSFFMCATSIALLAAVALVVAPAGYRRLVLAALIVVNPIVVWGGQLAFASALLRPYTSVLLAALICTAITELVRDWWEGQR